MTYPYKTDCDDLSVKFDLSKVKLVLWDFDDTLCIHSWHGNNDNQTHDYNTRVLREGTGAWSQCKPSKTMKRFMDVLCEKNIKQGLISATTSAKHMIAKVV